MTEWDAEKAGDDVPKTWPEWTDVLGQTYRPDDYVAYAMISGRSPQLVIARVVRINRVNSKGQEITTRVWPNGHWERDASMIEVPYCTITLLPTIDARGFSRVGGKPVTLFIPENIIKIDADLVHALEAQTEAKLQELRKELRKELS